MKMTVQEIARIINAQIEGDATLDITGVAKIEEAQAGHISFVSNPKYAQYLTTTKASAVIVSNDLKGDANTVLLRTANPYFAFMKVVRQFFPQESLIEKGVHPTAVIHETAQLGENIRIGAHVVVGSNCQIGSDTVLMPGVVIGSGVTIGEGCTIHARVSLRERVVLGDRVVIHDGTVIGSDGFGFAPEGGTYHKIPQVGIVIIEDDVEIGANTTIDRASLGETRIKRGAKLDNLIQVGHNCTIGENTVIAAQTGLSGSTHIGRHVRVGGQVGFAGHMSIGDNVAIGAQSGVSKSVPSDQFVFGYPAKPHGEAFRIQAAVHRLPELVKELRALKKRLEKLENNTRNSC